MTSPDAWYAASAKVLERENSRMTADRPTPAKTGSSADLPATEAGRATSDFAVAVSALHHAYYAIPAGEPSREQVDERLPALYEAVQAVLDTASRFGGLIATVTDADKRGIPVHVGVGESCEAQAAASDAGLRAALDEARKAIESEIAMASDPEGKDAFEQGALAAHNFALSVLPEAATPADAGASRITAQRLADALFFIGRCDNPNEDCLTAAVAILHRLPAADEAEAAPSGRLVDAARLVLRMEQEGRLEDNSGTGALEDLEEALAAAKVEEAPSGPYTVVGNGDGTMQVTFADGTEHRMTEAEYLALPRPASQDAKAPSTGEGLDVERLRVAVRNVREQDPALYLERGDDADAISAEYARLASVGEGDAQEGSGDE